MICSWSASPLLFGLSLTNKPSSLFFVVLAGEAPLVVRPEPPFCCPTAADVVRAVAGVGHDVRLVLLFA
jgi:hypothetical protein